MPRSINWRRQGTKALIVLLSLTICQLGCLTGPFIFIVGDAAVLIAAIVYYVVDKRQPAVSQ
ncbi:MAG: hypothetical protein ABIB97_03605 [Patescibacteria group bacterium]